MARVHKEAEEAAKIKIEEMRQERKKAKEQMKSVNQSDKLSSSQDASTTEKLLEVIKSEVAEEDDIDNHELFQ